MNLHGTIVVLFIHPFFASAKREPICVEWDNRLEMYNEEMYKTPKIDNIFIFINVSIIF